MNVFNLHILAADKVFYEGPCESLIVPTTEGQYGIMANHSNMMAGLKAGEIVYRVPGEENVSAAISEGMIKVKNNEVTVLVTTIELPEEIDENRARRAMEQAKERMLQKKSLQEYKVASAELSRAMSRLKVKNHKK